LAAGFFGFGAGFFGFADFFGFPDFAFAIFVQRIYYVPLLELDPR